MKIKELKNIVKVAHKSWAKHPATNPAIPHMIGVECVVDGVKRKNWGFYPLRLNIENNIRGTFEEHPDLYGNKRQKFIPLTTMSSASNWRVGIPYLTRKGKLTVLWFKAFWSHLAKKEGRDEIVWLSDGVWDVDNQKELRRDASDNIIKRVVIKAERMAKPVNDIKLNRTPKGEWSIVHNGHVWNITKDTDTEATFKYVVWLSAMDGRNYDTCATVRRTLRDAKEWLKYESGSWLASQNIKSYEVN